MIKVSVIVPVYNVEKYLEECLDSVCHQTLKDIEIICINDGSKDKSEQILKDYIKKDKRIVLIEQKNQGLSIARNNGIKIAKGQYIGFVDSDDKIEPDFFEKLYNAASKNDADIAIGGYKEINKRRKIKTILRYWKNEKITQRTKMLETLLGTAFVWNKLYKKELIINNQIYFPAHKTYEDGFWTPQIAACTKSVCTVRGAYYLYRYNFDSITNTTSIDPKKQQDARESRLFYDNFILENNLNLALSLKSKTKISLFGINLFQFRNYGNCWTFLFLGMPILKGKIKKI